MTVDDLRKMLKDVPGETAVLVEFGGYVHRVDIAALHWDLAASPDECDFRLSPEFDLATLRESLDEMEAA